MSELMGGEGCQEKKLVDDGSQVELSGGLIKQGPGKKQDTAPETGQGPINRLAAPGALAP